MSRAAATLTFDDGTVLHGIYNGTVDYMQGFMALTSDAAWDVWSNYNGRDEDLFPKCPHAGDHVIVSSEYGGGDSWEGRACRQCGVFKGPYRSPATREAFD
jgi:hypothetical protein